MIRELLVFGFTAFLFCCGVWLFRPLVAALAQRLAGGGKSTAATDEVAALRTEFLDEVHQVRQEVSELAERVDFTERLLATKREAEPLPPARR
jgi:hypothetical protein